VNSQIIIFIVGLSFTFVIGSVHAIPSNRENGKIDFNGHDYELFTVLKTWAEAKADCEIREGHLVTITS